MTLPIEIGDWRPGVYFAVVRNDQGTCLRAADRQSSAPHQPSRRAHLRPDLVPANFYDGDHDGFPDSWYAGGRDVVKLARPFDHSGVPWLFGGQDWRSLRWLRLHEVKVDFLAEADAAALGSALAEDYDPWSCPHT